MRWRTLDRDTGRDAAATFYTTEQLGPRREKTPEGFLVCYDVPVARTGEMIYGPEETPVAVGPDGRAVITRTAAEVFKAESMASLNGKPLADDHPPVDVDPDNYQFYLRGVVLNPRRGSGDHRDCLLADILVYDKRLIQDVEDGKVEVSCGYNPEYLPVLDAEGREVPGRGEQVGILYNHLALVERGRCGPRCAIRDHRTIDKENRTMASTWKDVKARILDAFAKKDQRALDAALDEAPAEGGGSEGHHIEVHNHLPPGENGEGGGSSNDEMPPWFKKHTESTDARFQALHDAVSAMAEHAGVSGSDRGRDAETKEEREKREREEREASDRGRNSRDNRDVEAGREILGELEFEAPPGTGDGTMRATRDSALLADSFQDALSKAEVLAPGLSPLPTYDPRARPEATLRTIDHLRRTALDVAYAQAETRGVIDAALSGRPLNTKAMKIGAVRSLFGAVAAAQAASNNRRATDQNPGGGYQPAVGGGLPVKGTVRNLHDINERNRARFKKTG